MCGIVGCFHREKRADEHVAMLRAMVKSIKHRGPDDDGVWVGESCAGGLGHARLSILDLSPLGHQPMHSHCGRYVIAYNGEIYNFPDMRAELEGCGRRFRGESDTEVVLEAIAEWGVETALQRFVGMFAFACVDLHTRHLYIARDRVGIKPLYYGALNGFFVCASELKAIESLPGVERTMDPRAIEAMLRLGYIPAPLSVYRGVYKLLPGHFARVSLTAAQYDVQVQQYWELDAERARRGGGMEGDGSDEAVACIEALHEHLIRAVQDRLRSDVPLGVFLSGGVDSSLVASIAQRQVAQPIKTFSIGFDDQEFDEGPHARRVAEHLRTDHNELYVRMSEVQGAVTEIAHVYDEPHADVSCVPTFLLSKLTREQVIVALSGDGGDELFGGYNRYAWGERVWGALAKCPVALRSAASRMSRCVSTKSYDRLYHALRWMLPTRFRISRPGQQVHKMAGLATARDQNELYALMLSTWRDDHGIFAGDAALCGTQRVLELLRGVSGESMHFIDRMMYADMHGYMTDNVLTKVDRASMAVGLEVRVPLLDHRVIEYAWHMPMNMKLRDGVSKWALRKILYSYVPQSIIERPKMGFAMPVHEWLRGGLRDWCESHLEAGKLQDLGIVKECVVRDLWKQYLQGRDDLFPQMWNLLMLQAWRGCRRR